MLCSICEKDVFLKSGSLFLQKINVLNWTTGNGITHQVGSSIYKPCCVYCIYTVHKESCRIKSKRKRSAHLRGPTNITFGWEDFLTKGHIYVPYMYSLFHINWCRLCIRVSAKKSRGKNLIGALEVSYRPTDTKFFPLSAKQKAD